MISAPVLLSPGSPAPTCPLCPLVLKLRSSRLELLEERVGQGDGAACGPLWTRLSDLFGRKAVLLGDLAIFSAVNLFAGLAPSMGLLIVARALQGVGGTALITLVVTSLPLPDARGTDDECFRIVWTVLADVIPPTRRGRWQAMVEINISFVRGHCSLFIMTGRGLNFN